MNRSKIFEYTDVLKKHHLSISFIANLCNVAESRVHLWFAKECSIRDTDNQCIVGFMWRILDHPKVFINTRINQQWPIPNTDKILFDKLIADFIYENSKTYNSRSQLYALGIFNEMYIVKMTNAIVDAFSNIKFKKQDWLDVGLWKIKPDSIKGRMYKICGNIQSIQFSQAQS